MREQIISIARRVLDSPRGRDGFALSGVTNPAYFEGIIELLSDFPAEKILDGRKGKVKSCRKGHTRVEWKDYGSNPNCPVCIQKNLIEVQIFKPPYAPSTHEFLEVRKA